MIAEIRLLLAVLLFCLGTYLVWDLFAAGLDYLAIDLTFNGNQERSGIRVSEGTSRGGMGLSTSTMNTITSPS